MDKATMKVIEDCAFDATVGAGNDSERVLYGTLERRLGRQATFEERSAFREAWLKNLQQIHQP